MAVFLSLDDRVSISIGAEKKYASKGRLDKMLDLVKSELGVAA